MPEKQQFDASPLADAEERNAIFAVLDSFRQYRRQSHFTTTHQRRQNFYALPKAHQQLLNSPPFNFLDWLNEVDDAIDENADIADAILNLALMIFGLDEEPDADSESHWHQTCKPGDLAKAHSTIRQFWRDWSSDGFVAEVKPILNLVLEDLAATLPLPPVEEAQANVPKLLLPGAGLGRLLFELCISGYNVEGNEISYHQLFASNFVLNTVSRAKQYRLYPFATLFTNHLSRSAQLSCVSIPDIHPGTVMSEQQQSAGRFPGEMNMSAGDFITSYSSKESENSFEAVVTVYFIDTAPNLVRYIETVRHCLVERGIWINIGPLLWHFDERMAVKEDSHIDKSDSQMVIEDQKATPPRLKMEDNGIGEPGSFELTEEEVVSLLRELGFEVLKHEILPTEIGGYIQDSQSMIQSRYRCSHWVARKL